jgi:hypothetical protein
VSVHHALMAEDVLDVAHPLPPFWFGLNLASV